jgi:uncharacterized protein YbjQ (UPF0145 family)
MKSKSVAEKYGLNLQYFDAFLKQSQYRFSQGMLGGLDIEDGQDIETIIKDYKRWADDQQAAAEQQQQAEQQARQEKQQALASILITSGFNFDGYTITKYSGYISGDDAVQIDRGTQGFWGGGVTNVGDALMNALVQIRRNALNELKEAALALGCNAVIGVDFDYLTLDPETVNNQGGTLYLPYVFGVTANGNAVIIEKNN